MAYGADYERVVIAKVILAIAVAVASVVVVGPAWAGCSSSAQAGATFYTAKFGCARPPKSTHKKVAKHSVATDSPFSAYEYRSACAPGKGNVSDQYDGCEVVDSCGPKETPARLWGLHGITWHPQGIRCLGGKPPLATAPPQVTPGMVLKAFRQIPLPAPRAHTQPATKTLINFDTIFYTDAPAFDRTLTLLGQRVTLAIKPTTFRWHHGDGTTSTTTTAGAAYPSKDIVYRYQHAHTTVAQYVEIVWGAHYRVGNGAWQPVNGTVTTQGPATPLRIAEATPALSGQRG